MPEGPELHLASRLINAAGKTHMFGGPIVKSDVSTKNPSVDWKAAKYNITAESRGKELKVYLRDVKNNKAQTHILFRFGMSGCFKLVPANDLPKHAHLRFFTREEDPQMALCFVDYRRFGRWELEGAWGKDRGPDPMFEYPLFRSNILDNLQKAAFNKPLCEVMLNQTFFNGIGNYLRAEIIFRAGLRPFDQARSVIEKLKDTKVKKEEGDLLELCNIVPKEVLDLAGGKGYDSQPDPEEEAAFSDWLQCYNVEGMKNLVDSNGRTIWFMGEPGNMAPKNSKTRGRGSPKKKDEEPGKVKEEGKAKTKKTMVKKEAADPLIKIENEKKVNIKDLKAEKSVDKKINKDDNKTKEANGKTKRGKPLKENGHNASSTKKLKKE